MRVSVEERAIEAACQALTQHIINGWYKSDFNVYMAGWKAKEQADKLYTHKAQRFKYIDTFIEVYERGYLA